jgi:hypothetical protein
MNNKYCEAPKPGEYRVVLLVSYVRNGRTKDVRVHELNLPFAPTLGMQIHRSGVNAIWITEREELTPVIERVIYDLDEDQFICTFTVGQLLTSAFWRQIESPQNSEFRDYLSGI